MTAEVPDGVPDGDDAESPAADRAVSDDGIGVVDDGLVDHGGYDYGDDYDDDLADRLAEAAMRQSLRHDPDQLAGQTPGQIADETADKVVVEESWMPSETGRLALARAWELLTLLGASQHEAMTWSTGFTLSWARFELDGHDAQPTTAIANPRTLRELLRADQTAPTTAEEGMTELVECLGVAMHEAPDLGEAVRYHRVLELVLSAAETDGIAVAPLPAPPGSPSASAPA